jgi:hypothetical protein
MKSAFLMMACIAACLVPLPGLAQSVADLLRQGFAVRRAVIPLYSGPDRKLSIVVSIDQSGVEYQRKGFFRIGILPVQVLEGVTFDLQDPSSAAASLQRVRRWFGVGTRVELRRVKFVFQGNTMEAARVRFDPGQQWQLLGGVRLVCDGRETRAARGAFNVCAGQPGQVTLETSPRSTHTFLPSTLASKRPVPSTSSTLTHEDNDDCCGLDDGAKFGDGAVTLQSRHE